MFYYYCMQSFSPLLIQSGASERVSIRSGRRTGVGAGRTGEQLMANEEETLTSLGIELILIKKWRKKKLKQEITENNFFCFFFFISFFRPCRTKRRNDSTKWQRRTRRGTTPRCRITYRPKARKSAGAKSASTSKIPMHPRGRCKYQTPIRKIWIFRPFSF